MLGCKVGDKVHYIPFEGCDPKQFENGIVKSVNLNPSHAFVVYNCGGDWENYMNYSAASTNLNNLKPGWHEIFADIL